MCVWIRVAHERPGDQAEPFQGIRVGFFTTRVDLESDPIGWEQSYRGLFVLYVYFKMILNVNTT